MSARSDETQRPLVERMFDATLRVERIVHTETMLVDAPDDDLIEWLTNHDDTVEAIKEAVGWDASWGELGDMDRDEFMEATWGLKGWVIEVAQPVMEPIGDRGTLSFSWGYYTTKRFFAPTYDEALERAIEWGDAEYERARQAALSGSREVES